jgi:hypothetical protein
MITTWKIAQLKRIPNTGLVTHVTYIMNFELDGEIDRLVGSITLTGDVNDPDFVPFENLTEEDVIAWVQATLGEVEIITIEADYQSQLEERILNKQNPEFLEGTPW